MKFCYAPFEATLWSYFTASTGEVDNYPDIVGYTARDNFSAFLLSAGLRGQSLGDVVSVDSTALSRYRTGERQVHAIIRDKYTPSGNAANEVIHGVVQKYFEDKVLPYIDESYIGFLVQDLKEIIDSDLDIPLDVKDKFMELASCHTPQEFLASAFIFAVQEHPQRNAMKIALSNLPFERNIWFTGRKSSLQSLYDNFRNGKARQIISGMPGCGKTQLALEYVYWRARSYDYICWVNAEDESQILRSMDGFLKTVKAPRCERTNRYDIARDFLSWTNANKSWLIIYDNIDYSSDDWKNEFEERYLPKHSENGKIIFTSRNNVSFSDEPIIQLDVFPRDKSIFFIKNRSWRKISKTDANKLAERLGDLPIALEQASAFLRRHTTETCESYIRLLDQYQTKFFNRFDKPRGHKLSAYETVATAVDKLNNRGADALLRLLAYASPDGTDLLTIKAMVNHYSGDAPVGLREIFVDRLSFYEAVDTLASYSLCNFVGSDDDKYAPFGGIKAIRFHRLVQEVLRDIIGEDDFYFHIHADYYRAALFGDVKDESGKAVFEARDFLKRAVRHFENSSDPKLLCNIADMLAIIVLGTGFSIKEDAVWAFSNLNWFACRGYGDDSVQAAFAMTRSFSNRGWSDYKTGVELFLKGLEVEMRKFPQYVEYIYDLHNTKDVHEDVPTAIEDANLTISFRTMHLLQDIDSLTTANKILANTETVIRDGIVEDDEMYQWFDEGGRLRFRDFIDDLISELNNLPEDEYRITSEERDNASLWWSSQEVGFY